MQKNKIKKLAVATAAAMLLLFTAVGCKALKSTDEAVTNTVEATETTETEHDTAALETEQEPAAEEAVRIGSLKGATSIGLVSLMHQAGKAETINDYRFTIETTADTLLPMMIKKELDIALLPANVASILYQKSEGAVCVIDINTLGLLYVVSADDSVASIQDLKGKTLYLTGKGTTPDFAIQYLLEKNNLTTEDVTLEYKSEATEVAALLAENPESYGLLPQPFATAACVKNSALKEVIDITAEWDLVSADSKSRLVTGVTVVRKEFLEQRPDAVAAFLTEHQASAEFANTEVEDAAELVADLGIIEKAEIAVKAMPKCNITYIDGEAMKTALSGYLQTLYDLNPDAVGGSLPKEDFYWTGA